MNVNGLTPREYWETSQEDMELVTMLQHELQAGKDEEAKEIKEKAEKDAERKKKEREAMDRLKARAGMG